ncbi:hypothetical protein L484_027571 [Morus notabilis]|uniref:Phytocyanin domain-containing protein n=1 Tax=Morus notabilis TaxID=981085 RepID=W9SMP1_9ROSA|nr:uncharacterized protein LOC21410185 [Morus notabilis]EXC17379.1 hypothetical protein L484_027571 [Morus notabilis]
MGHYSSTNSLAMKALAIMLFASVLAGSCLANRDRRFGFNYTDWRLKHRGWWYRHHHPNKTQEVLPSKILVGGSENWRFNFSYTDWAFKHGPFYLNDTLVFKYDPPADSNSHPHNVYLLPDLKSYVNCNLSNAKQIANETQGSGEGFEFVLDKWQPYYFACGASNGFHCSVGRMKFYVMPMLRAWRT